MIRFPIVASPRVSVVMATRDAWDWTERALRALAEHTPPVYEVIVVDNASSAPAVEHLRRDVEGIRLIANPENRGFGPANNQGAAVARGEVLAPLNSDLIVHAGWLEPLLEVLDADPACGAVAARVLNVDGTLQEAGALVARDGTTLKLGDGDPADATQHRFRRRVDYAGAECLLIRREAFAAAGGFDDAYAPAYYEDADLCLALAARGLSTVYEPRSVVTHGHHGSGGWDAAQRLTDRNRPLFAARWAAVLADRPPSVEPWRPRRVLESRDALAPARVLLAGVATDDPDPPPGVRVTTTLGEPDRGIEVVDAPGDWEAWLGGRRFFYDVVVTPPDPDPALAAALRRTQPQAVRATARRVGRADLGRLLAAAGATP